MVLIILKFCIPPPGILDDRATCLFVVPLWYCVHVVPCCIMFMWLDTFLWIMCFCLVAVGVGLLDTQIKGEVVPVHAKRCTGRVQVYR
jgi:hypothetical protein